MISVIVPAYNGENTLGRCLAALAAQTIEGNEVEIIVVDDGSTDRTAEVARSYPVRLIQQANAGPGAARNAGAREASGELLLFTDADCAPAPDWISRMAEPFREPDVVGAKGVYRTRQRELVARFVQLEYEERYARMARLGQIDFVDTYSAAYRRDVFQANGGFDELMLTDEDQELSFRLARKGYRLVFVPQAVVYHVHCRTPGEYWRRKFNIGSWKALLLGWHPERVASDSHTPQLLKIQIALLALLVPLASLAVFWGPACWVALGTAACFALTMAPFLARVARRDARVLVVAPWLLVCRALALGTGLVVGSMRLASRGRLRRAPISGWKRLVKRSVDIVVSLAGLIAAAPVVGLIGAAIKLDSPGPVLFVQERVAENGRRFNMLKLRTMVADAEATLPALVDLKSLPSPAFKLSPDPRVTRLGRFLRRWSLDELPQLWNVLKGEMSLVGPRPEETRVVQLYNDEQRQRLAVKPGMTGPMQVHGRGELSLDERLRLELDYIEHHSLWKDLTILVQTVGAVVSGRGAY